MARGRKLHLSNGEVWTWDMVSAGGTIKIRRPDRKAFAVPMSAITGLTENDIERGYWKGTRDAWVTPRTVKAYIERELLA
jgi:hypothetical protein